MSKMRYALIPAYQPDERLIEITKQLAAYGFHVVIVDDGSGDEYADIFFEVLSYADIFIHEQNRGKGAALKTGLEAIAAKAGEDYVVVTLDADGQHAIEDVHAVRDSFLIYAEILKHMDIRMERRGAGW